MTSLQFAAWMKTPLGAAVEKEDAPVDLGRAGFQPGVTVRSPTGSTELVLGPEFDLIGPGSVTGIDPDVVTRIEPARGAVNVEPNYLAAIEFSSPELPWILTPARASGARLRPWLVLVVVDAATTFVGHFPLPVLHVSS